MIKCQKELKLKRVITIRLLPTDSQASTCSLVISPFCCILIYQVREIYSNSNTKVELSTLNNMKNNKKGMVKTYGINSKYGINNNKSMD